MQKLNNTSHNLSGHIEPQSHNNFRRSMIKLTNERRDNLINALKWANAEKPGQPFSIVFNGEAVRVYFQGDTDQTAYLFESD